MIARQFHFLLDATRPAIARLENPLVNQLNTTILQDLGPDGFTWAQAYQPTFDRYGKIATQVQRHNTGLYWVVSNDNGVTWTDITASPGDGVYPVPVTRSSIAYDSVSDAFHVLYRGVDPGDGMIYRRYTPTRDSNNNITGFTKDANTNLQLDLTNGGTMTYAHPIIFWLSDIGSKGTLVCFWSALNIGVGGGMEVRASMRTLTNTSADGVAGNWTHLGIDSATSIGNAPAVDYTAIVSSSATSGGYPAVLRKQANTHVNDFYVFYAESVTGSLRWRCKRMIWNAGQWTSLSSAMDVGNFRESGTDSGYTGKVETGSKPVEDTVNDLVYYAYSAWKNNTDGDAWLFKSINTSDVVSSPTYVYYSVAANNHTDIFITGDIIFHPQTKTLIVSYTDLPNKDAFVVAYKNGVLVSGPLNVFSDAPVDIPILFGNPVTLNGKLALLFRDFNDAARNNPPTYTPPYNGYLVTVDI